MSMKNAFVSIILMYLKVCAKIALALSNVKIIGITGSAGKTSARDAVAAVLQSSHKIHVIRKGNSETGVPLGLLGLKVHSLGFDSLHRSIQDWTKLLILAPTRILFLRSFEYVLVEMGVDDPFPPKNMEYLLGIVKPDIAIILNALPVHAEQFEKVVEGKITEKKIVEAIAHEKSKIAVQNEACELVIFNADNSAVKEALEGSNIEMMSFGAEEANTVSYAGYEIDEDSTHFSFKVKGKSLKLNIGAYMLPDVYREVFAAAMCVGLYSGKKPGGIKEALENNLELEPGRSTLLKGVHDSVIIDSSYNAPPKAVRSVLEMAYQLKRKTGRPLVFVMGDMRELGASAEREHAGVAEMIPGKADYLYTVGPLTHKYVYNALKSKRSMKDVQSFMSPHDAGKHLKNTLPDRAIVLFKGSQNTIFLEEAIKYILEDPSDSAQLPRQEDYWMRKKQFSLTKQII